MKKSALAILALCFTTTGVGVAGAPNDATGASRKFTWQQNANHLSLRHDGSVVWQFNYAPGQALPFFHPLALPGGPPLTWLAPQDHPWHYGHWFAWKYLNGVNYWEINPQTGQQDGHTRWGAVRVTTHADFSAHIELNLTYAPREGQPPALTEKRTIHISAPAADGSYQLDWDMTFTAGAESVRLERTPLAHEPDGKDWGGYAGLSLRLASNIVAQAAVTSEGPVAFAGGRYRGRALAADYAGRFAGEEAGIAMLDSPKNPDSPTPWYVVSDGVMDFISPAVICFQPITLMGREHLRLRYRVIVHPGRWDAEKLRRHAESFGRERGAQSP